MGDDKCVEVAAVPAYAPAAGRLWRWTAAPQDVPVGRFVHGFVAAGVEQQAALRRGLSADDLATLLVFARRRSLAAIRVRDQRAVVDAFDALSIVDASRAGRREVVVAAMVAAFAARAAGVAAATAAVGAAGRATAETAAILRAETSRRKVDLAGEAGLRLVVTADGPVLVEDGLGRYRPVRDLLPVVLGIDAVLAAEGAYRTESVMVADAPPEHWVEPGTAALTKLTGCASLQAAAVAPAARDGLPDSLTVLVAEARTDRAAHELAGAADRRGMLGAVVLGVPCGRLCAVLVVRNPRAGAFTMESYLSMTRFRPAVTEVLLRAR